MAARIGLAEWVLDPGQQREAARELMRRRWLRDDDLGDRLDEDDHGDRQRYPEVRASRAEPPDDEAQRDPGGDLGLPDNARDRPDDIQTRQRDRLDRVQQLPIEGPNQTQMDDTGEDQERDGGKNGPGAKAQSALAGRRDVKIGTSKALDRGAAPRLRVGVVVGDRPVTCEIASLSLGFGFCRA